MGSELEEAWLWLLGSELKDIPNIKSQLPEGKSVFIAFASVDHHLVQQRKSCNVDSCPLGEHEPRI